MEDIILDSTHISNDEHLMVKITNAFKKYDTTTVLNGFNMNVSKGVIYGLLGPSGCGKTTLLSSIIGRTRLNSGQIKLGVKRKKQIGYMPQDLALYDEFSMLETLHYFGSLYEMSYDEIIDKGEKLLNFMEMPPFTTQFGTMSGGQQRRFSLCVALLHDPSLLILDEPTVGVDPIISASIWTYLQDLTNRGKTIIITTHYIEEARQANMIGLMRKGVLLAEASPLDIMESCNADTLESAFLILSQKHSAHMSTERKISNTPQSSATTTLKKSSFFSKTRFKAQLLKHWYWSVRNWKIIGFVCILPIFTLLLFNILIGQTPDPLNFGIINKEINKHTCQKIQLEEMCNDQIPLSCKYLYHLKNSEITLKYYDDEELAKSDALYNNIWGYLLFSNNFTNLINKRYNDSFGMSSEDFEHMTISSSIDMSDFITSKLIQSKLINSFEELSKAFNHCNSTSVRYIDPRPFKIMEPVFGKLKVNIVEYGTPAIISIMEFYLTFLFTALSICMEKNRGLMERSLSAGLTVTEVLLSQLLVQIIMLVIQTFTIFTLQFIVFDFPFLSPWTGPLTIVFLQGICGTFLGFASSIAFNEERTTTFIGIGIVLTQVFLSGLMWPTEAMHPIIRNFAKILPLTLSIEAFRSMISRNWGIQHIDIFSGFISIIVWILIAVLISILNLKFKQGIQAKK